MEDLRHSVWAGSICENTCFTNVENALGTRMTVTSVLRYTNNSKRSLPLLASDVTLTMESRISKLNVCSAVLGCCL